MTSKKRKPKPSYLRLPDGRYARCRMCGERILITDDVNHPVEMSRMPQLTRFGTVWRPHYYHAFCGHLPVKRKRKV